MTRLKAFADDKLEFARMTISHLHKSRKSTVGKGENAGYQHFLPFQQYFPKSSSLWSLKVKIVGKELTFYQTSKLRYFMAQMMKLVIKMVENIVEKHTCCSLPAMFSKAFKIRIFSYLGLFGDRLKINHTCSCVPLTAASMFVV